MKENCGWCNQEINICNKEWKRQKKKGRQLFFCNLSCSAYYRNSKRTDLVEKITKKCPVCSNNFDTYTGKNERFFCSSSCASKGSVTEKRRKKARELGIKNSKNNFISLEEILRLREGWKYKLIEEILKNNNINYQFEYRIENYIYDLAIFEKRLLFEFDGTYHTGEKQLERDNIKNKVAKKNSWNLIRIQTISNEIIQSDFLYKYI